MNNFKITSAFVLMSFFKLNKHFKICRKLSGSNAIISLIVSQQSVDIFYALRQQNSLNCVFGNKSPKHVSDSLDKTGHRIGAILQDDGAILSFKKSSKRACKYEATKQIIKL